MGYPIQLAREDRAGGGDVSEARGRGLRPYRAQHRRTAVPRGVKSRIPRSTRQSLVLLSSHAVVSPTSRTTTTVHPRVIMGSWSRHILVCEYSKSVHPLGFILILI
eukprot:COSAG01_NODE_26_length_36857_cov_31.426166_21_plen_106_part_00